MNNILEVSGLRKSCGNFALKDLALCLPEGCITGFIGANGAGKTTTLRTLLRLANKEAGEVRFFGLDMEKNEKQIKNRLGVVLDDGCFYEELSLAEMKSILAPAYTAWSERDFGRYMEMFRLDPGQKIHAFSKGMRMKYALALALSHEAELLIMDEPTSGLDPLVRSQLLDTLADYMNKGGRARLVSKRYKAGPAVCALKMQPPDRREKDAPAREAEPLPFCPLSSRTPLWPRPCF